MVRLFFIFRGPSKLFSTWLYQFASLPAQCARVLISPHPHPHLLSFAFFLIAILTDARWALTAVLSWSSLIIGDVEHLLAIWVSSLEKCLFKSWTHFNQVIHFCFCFVSFLLLSCRNSLCVLEISLFFRDVFHKYFFPFLRQPFCPVDCFLWCGEAF